MTSSFFLLIVLLTAAACSQQPSATPVAALDGGAAATLTFTPTPAAPTGTATPTPPPSATPSPTATPTPTLTPTPTALPLIVRGDPLADRAVERAALGNGTCGVVDWLDFPIDPPIAENVTRGGQDFGVFRARFNNKYHAGEDWSAPAGQSNFGHPVHAIGHGLVTYAEPEGWNRDKGVVIIQHTFVDGGSVLSFYGHLDPPSVTLKAGDCIRRGDIVGNIGRPRSPPHLHFEIRTFMPYAPGPGYWPEDPTTAGWLPPSEFIWRNRMAASPGVAWVMDTGADPQPAGMLNGQPLFLEETALRARTLESGAVAWSMPLSNTVAAAVAHGGTIYTADRAGRVTAYAASDGPPEPLWQNSDGAATGMPALFPLPGGGVLLLAGSQGTLLGPDGALRWNSTLDRRIDRWTHSGGQLIVSAPGETGGVWTVGEEGARQWRDVPGGTLADSGGELWLHADRGVYRLDAAARSAVLLYPLAAPYRDRGDMVALPDGGILLAHVDAADRRLIALNPDGSLRWERSFRGEIAGESRLLLLEGRPYLLDVNMRRAPGQVTLYAIGENGAVLERLFTGGTRSARPMSTWAADAGDGRLLLNVGGGDLLLLDVPAAGP